MQDQLYRALFSRAIVLWLGTVPDLDLHWGFAGSWGDVPLLGRACPGCVLPSHNMASNRLPRMVIDGKIINEGESAGHGADSRSRPNEPGLGL
jgi:hypothetical protein